MQHQLTVGTASYIKDVGVHVYGVYGRIKVMGSISYGKTCSPTLHCHALQTLLPASLSPATTGAPASSRRKQAPQG